MILQTAYPPTNIVVGDILSTATGTTSGYTTNCYEYVGNYVNYVAPSGFITSTQDTFTATTATTYTSCLTCLQVEPLVDTFTIWIGKGAYSVSCPLCQLTNFGSQVIFYTLPSVTQLQTGVTVYNNSSLLNPLTVDYIQYGTKIYSVDNSGVITELCTVNGNC
jgi:hypothetical protein